jgi:hypothetical protein
MWPAYAAGLILALVIGAGHFTVARNQIIPVLGVASCLYLIYYLPPTSWLRFAAWLNFGFLIFAIYGSLKSRLTGRDTVPDKGAHDLATATHASWLYVGGTALLAVTHSLDVAMASWKVSADGGQAFAAIFTADSWLTPSGFMLVPLLLNAVLLAPIAIRRALMARVALRQSGSPAPVVVPVATLSGIAGLSMFYALAVLVRALG